MIAGLSGMLTLLLAGLALVAARRVPKPDRDPAEHLGTSADVEARTPIAPWRKAAVLLGLLTAAASCGYHLQAIHDECLSLRWGSHLVIVVEGLRFYQLYMLHAILTLALTLTALGLWHRLSSCSGGWHSAARKPERLVGIAGLLTAIASFLAFQSTFPSSINDGAGRGYFILLLLITVPVATLLAMVSLLLLLRPRTPLGIQAYSDFPLCLVCGYNLTGNASGRCPECGGRIPPDVAVRLAGEHPCMVTQGQSRWPRSIVSACLFWAAFTAAFTFTRMIEPLNRAVSNLAPGYLIQELLRSPTYFSIHPYVVFALRLVWAGVLVIGAMGLRRHRRWGAWICLAWAIASVPPAVLDAAVSAGGYAYGVSPGSHTDVLCLQVAFAKTLLNAGFPMFLGLWLSQRHVLHRIAAWPAH